MPFKVKQKVGHFVVVVVVVCQLRPLDAV